MSTYYWHFAQVDDHGTPRLGYDDNRAIRLGETLRVEGKPVTCAHGLHASAKLWDALDYARGNKLSLCRVTLGGEIVHDDDKSAANERTVIAMLDADATEKLLRDWGRWCALQVIHLWDAPDVVRQYLQTGDESLRDATWAAAWDATRNAARAVARAAARAAAWDASRAATRGAARAAAWDAAWAVAWAAARAVARAAARAVAIETYAAELEQRALVTMGLAEVTP